MKFAVSGEDVEKQNLIPWAQPGAHRVCDGEGVPELQLPSWCPESHGDLYTNVYSSIAQQAEGRNSSSAHQLMKG